MPPDITGIGADGFHKGVLCAFYSIFHLRRGSIALIGGSHFKGDGPYPWKQHHTKAIDQQQSHCIQIDTGLGYIIIDHAGHGVLIKLLHGFALKMLGNGLKNIIRRIRRGNEAVDCVGVKGMVSAMELPGHKIRRIPENVADVLIV